MANYNYSSSAYRMNQSAAPAPRRIQLEPMKASAVPARKESRETQLRMNAVRKNREKVKRMDFGYAAFLTLAIAATVLILTQYVSLKSDITNRTQNISVLEAQLNTLQRANDETESRLNSKLDLGEVRRIAMDELGMTYAKEGQIQLFEGEDSDYVRQVADLPE